MDPTAGSITGADRQKRCKEHRDARDERGEAGPPLIVGVSLAVSAPPFPRRRWLGLLRLGRVVVPSPGAVSVAVWLPEGVAVEPPMPSSLGGGPRSWRASCSLSHSPM
jgi:hypothetical protein